MIIPPLPCAQCSLRTGDCLVTVWESWKWSNAFGLRVFRREASAVEARSALANFEKDLPRVFSSSELYRILSFKRARQCPNKRPPSLETHADLLHVAAALELGVDYLYSFDQQQRQLARTVQLKLN